jgi:hypothetical protein
MIAALVVLVLLTVLVVTDTGGHDDPSSGSA